MKKYLLISLLAVGLLAFGTTKAKADDTQNYRPQFRFEERLNQAVIDGKMTEAQKQAFVAKRAEMQQEQQANREQHRAEMRTWAESQGINLDEMGFMAGPRGGMRMGFKAGANQL